MKATTNHEILRIGRVPVGPGSQAERRELLRKHADRKTAEGHQRIVRTVICRARMTGIGPVAAASRVCAIARRTPPSRRSGPLRHPAALVSASQSTIRWVPILYLKVSPRLLRGALPKARSTHAPDKLLVEDARQRPVGTRLVYIAGPMASSTPRDEAVHPGYPNGKAAKNWSASPMAPVRRDCTGTLQLTGAMSPRAPRAKSTKCSRQVPVSRKPHPCWASASVVKTVTRPPRAGH